MQAVRPIIVLYTVSYKSAYVIAFLSILVIFLSDVIRFCSFLAAGNLK